jgi:hypothetical protein
MHTPLSKRGFTIFRKFQIFYADFSIFFNFLNFAIIKVKNTHAKKRVFRVFFTKKKILSIFFTHPPLERHFSKKNKIYQKNTIFFLFFCKKSKINFNSDISVSEILKIAKKWRKKKISENFKIYVLFHEINRYTLRFVKKTQKIVKKIKIQI